MQYTTQIQRHPGAILRFLAATIVTGFIVAVLIVGWSTPPQDTTQASGETCIITENMAGVYLMPNMYDFKGKLTYNGNAQLYVYDFASGQLDHFNTTRGMTNPDWYPYGRLIVYGYGFLYLLDTRTGETLSLTESQEWGAWDPSWHPDGRHFVYATLSGLRGLFVYNLFSRKITQINVEVFLPYHPAWSPAGEHIVFASDDDNGISQIYVLNIHECLSSQSCKPIQLTYGETVLNYSPAWSPDGQEIAFTSKRDGYFAIYTMDADGSNVRRLTDNVSGDLNPAWSPDGQYIAFTRWEISDGPRHIRKHLYIMHRDGSNPVCLVADYGEEPDWWAGDEIVEVRGGL